jgi:hypothetical protein
MQKEITMCTSTLRLKRRFTMSLRADSAEDDPVRNEVLRDLAEAIAHAVHENVVVIETPLGAALLEATTMDGAPIVLVDHIRRDHWARVQFWTNASSLADVYARLHTLPRLTFEQIFLLGR